MPVLGWLGRVVLLAQERHMLVVAKHRRAEAEAERVLELDVWGSSGAVSQIVRPRLRRHLPRAAPRRRQLTRAARGRWRRRRGRTI